MDDDDGLTMPAPAKLPSEISCNPQQPQPPSTMTRKQRNQLRCSVKLTPWSGPAELGSVGRGLLLAAELFPPPATASPPSSPCCCPLADRDRAELDFALRRVAVWKDRAGSGRLPHAVETTAGLAGALLADATLHDGGGGGRPPSELTLRLSYSASVVRAANGLADAALRNRASLPPGSGSSVAALCDRVGIPGWIVDLRHDAAHNELPSLPSLRLAAKTLLGYFGDRYWNELGGARDGARDRAVAVLDAYRAAAKAVAADEARRAAAKAAAVAEAEDDDEPDDEDNEWEPDENNADADEEIGNEDLWKFGQYSILLDDGGVAKRLSADLTPAGSEPDATKTKRTSPVHIARQFVRDVPIDTGMNVLLTYLVWGGIGDMPPGRGGLIPGSPTTVPATEEGFAKIKARYRFLLTTVALAWTGFVHALIVNIVDLVIALGEDASDKASIDAGDERKLYFLACWAKYLISRECHMHLDASVAVCGDKKTDLKRKKKSKWSDDERAFMAECAPMTVLERAQLPLNSLCDRCAQSLSNGAGASTAELLSVFENALGDKRVKGTGVDTTLHMGKRKKEESNPEHINRPVKLSRIDASNGVFGGEKNEPLSLEEMEALLSDSDDDEIQKKKEGTSRNQGLEAKVETSPSPIDKAKRPSAWVLCKSWDACAIGTLPGHPS